MLRDPSRNVREPPVKLAYSYRSLMDWGDISRGHDLVQLLECSGLKIEKVDDKEPVRQDFLAQELPSYWLGRGLPGQHLTCYFLFKGSRPYKFSGMVTWKRLLPDESTWMNTLHMDFTISGKTRPEPDWLVGVGDQLFGWTQASHGFITDASLFNPLGRSPAKRLYLPQLFWVNYFGLDYLSSPDFCVPTAAVDMPSGKRLVIGNGYDDARLADKGFLETIVAEFGLGWFGEGHPDEFRMPDFDFSALRR